MRANEKKSIGLAGPIIFRHPQVEWNFPIQIRAGPDLEGLHPLGQSLGRIRRFLRMRHHAGCEQEDATRAAQTDVIRNYGEFYGEFLPQKGTRGRKNRGDRRCRSCDCGDARTMATRNIPSAPLIPTSSPLAPFLRLLAAGTSVSPSHRLIPFVFIRVHSRFKIPRIPEAWRRIVLCSFHD